MMEKLTELINGKGYCAPMCNRKDPCEEACSECSHMKAMVDKLAHYEDLEEQGLLLKLPCKVGAKVYVLWTSYNFKTDKVEHKVIVDVFEIEMMSDFGETVFLTKEEAEDALRKKEE